MSPSAADFHSTRRDRGRTPHGVPRCLSRCARTCWPCWRSARTSRPNRRRARFLRSPRISRHPSRGRRIENRLASNKAAATWSVSRPRRSDASASSLINPLISLARSSGEKCAEVTLQPVAAAWSPAKMFITLPLEAYRSKSAGAPPGGAPIALNRPPRTPPHSPRRHPAATPPPTRIRSPDLALRPSDEGFDEFDCVSAGLSARPRSKRNCRTSRDPRRDDPASEVFHHEDRTLLQFKGFGDFAVDALGLWICEQSLDRFAVRFPVGKRDRPVELAGVGARPALADANRDRAVPFQIRNAFSEKSDVLGVSFPPRNDNNRHLSLPFVVSR